LANNYTHFGQQLHPDRHAHTGALFEAIDAGKVEAIVSLYALQELCSYCYNTFLQTHAPHATRLALHTLLEHPLLIVPLLTRVDRILLGRRFPMSDTSDQVHACTAYREGCAAIITYDHHYQEIASLLSVFTPTELLQRIS
jgi:predicted nucleic acid-binding protein